MNIVFIIISFVLACKLPFELFIFAYVFLGPLHYLTELNWLNKRDFFVVDRKWVWVFIFLCLLISIPTFLGLPIANFIKKGSIINYLSGIINLSYSQIILFMFLFAIGLVYINKRMYLLLYFLGCIIAAFLIKKYVSFYVIVGGIFLPTIIHVYLFTLLFMILGALHTKSRWGIAGVILLILAPIIIFNTRINPSEYFISEYAKTSYLTSKMSRVNSYIAHFLQPSAKDTFYLFSGIGIKVQIFIAFCYTYHYLNWFSKTTVIGWGKVLSGKKLALIIIIWCGSILLYWYDNKTGFIALFFLSIVHVVLEFPLNIRSVKGIVSKINFPKKILASSD
ncbi:MAG TPA: hypothetical protein VIJ92_17490 [Ginsengibacter sp.]